MKTLTGMKMIQPKTSNTTANPIRIAAKLYDARDAMKFLFGERYEAEVKKTIVQLRRLSQAWDLSMIQTMTRACSEMSAKGDNGVGTGLVLAAYVEDVEGTFQ